MRQNRRVILAFALVAILGIAMHDILLPAQQTYGTRAALAAIDVYRAHVSPHLKGIVACRFTPTCSAYGRESIRKYGLLRGGARTIKRIARCNPWTKAGTVDLP